MNLHGSIPEMMFEKLTRLTEVALFKNELSGQIPTTIGLLKDAHSFLLGDNQFGGTLPRQMGLMADLKLFHVSGNNVAGSIPDLIFSLKDLEELTLAVLCN